MSRAAIEYWRRGRSRVIHAFALYVDTTACYYGVDGPSYDLHSLCDRHEFSLDSARAFKYRPWAGEDFPPRERMCKKCLAAEARP